MRLAIIAAATLLMGGSASAQVQRLTPDYRVVEHGRSIKVDAYGTYDPDCRTVGRVTINLISAPRGGTVETADGRDYPRFNQSNVRFHCNSRRLPALLLYYRASPDFAGTDTFVVEGIFGDGTARQNRYTVYVR